MGLCCNVAAAVASGAGVIVVIFGVWLGFFFLPDFVDDEIKRNTQLKEGTEQYDRFVEIPFPLDFKTYWFNVVNADDIEQNGAKPIVEEVGPYTYDKQSVRYDMVHDLQKGEITYYQKRFHKYNPDLSISDTDLVNVTIFNIAMVSVFQMMEEYPLDFLHDSLNRAYMQIFELEKDSAFHTLTVREISFTGYRFCKPSTYGSNKHAKFICALVRIVAPESMDIDPDRSVRFSFFNMKENRPDGIYTIVSGMKDIKSLGFIQKWNHADRLPFWLDDGVCNEVRGCDTTIYPPFNDRDTVFYAYNTDICRVVRLEYMQEMEHKDVSGKRYAVRNDTMDNDKYPCYCLKKTRDIYGHKECFPKGFQDVYTCMGAPVVLTHPHFLYADPKWANRVQGVNPVEYDHQIFVEVEPDTGTPLRGGKRVQFNVILRKLHFSSRFDSIDYPAVIPIVWVDESLTLGNEWVDDLKDMYLNMLPLIDIATWVIISLGIVMCVGFGALFVYLHVKYWKNKMKREAE